MIAALMITIAMAGVPPLTPDQQAGLAVNDPADELEGPALYPLLDNVLVWEPGQTDIAGVAGPDYDALSADPVAGRGGLYLVEGRFAGRARQFELSKPGRWGAALTEWVLIVRDDPQRVAVVYFVDPGQELETPRVGGPVRVPARFYKVWTDTDQEDRPTDYLTFIARSSMPVAATRSGARLGSALLMLGVLVLALVYVVVLRLSRSPGRQPRQTPETAKSIGDAMLSGLPDTALPDDPAEALEKLADRQHDS